MIIPAKYAVIHEEYKITNKYKGVCFWYKNKIKLIQIMKHYQ